MTAHRTARLTTLLALPAALALGAGAPAFAHAGHEGHKGHEGSSATGTTATGTTATGTTATGTTATGTTATGTAVSAKDGKGDGSYQIDLDSLNNSGATGTAMLTVDGTSLTVKIESRGLVPGQPHAQHLHGSTTGHDFHCPDMSADKNKDGIVTTAEGIPSYGDINISLTTKGDTSKGSGLAVDRMPVADKDGKVSYSRTLQVSQQVADHIKDLHVVQHGIDPNGNQKYDFGKGKSELDPKLPQEATAPAACGMVKGASVGDMPEGGVETGSGGTRGIENPGLLAGGAGALLAAAGVGAYGLSRRNRTAHSAR